MGVESDEQKVKQKYPVSWSYVPLCECCDPTIYAREQEGGRVFIVAEGKTEAEAWANAATRIEECK